MLMRHVHAQQALATSTRSARGYTPIGLSITQHAFWCKWPIACECRLAPCPSAPTPSSPANEEKGQNAALLPAHSPSRPHPPRLPLDYPPPTPPPPQGLVFSPDGRVMVVVAEPNQVAVYEAGACGGGGGNGGGGGGGGSSAARKQRKL